MFTRKPRLRLEKFAITCTKRPLQQNRHDSDLRQCPLPKSVRYPGEPTGMSAFERICLRWGLDLTPQETFRVEAKSMGLSSQTARVRCSSLSAERSGL